MATNWQEIEARCDGFAKKFSKIRLYLFLLLISTVLLSQTNKTLQQQQQQVNEILSPPDSIGPFVSTYTKTPKINKQAVPHH